MKEPNVNGTWRIDPEDNTHVEQAEDLSRGVWFVGYWADGRAIVYDEGVHSVFLETVRRDSVVFNTDDSEQIRVPQTNIEDWIREQDHHRLAALHPRYYWLLEAGEE